MKNCSDNIGNRTRDLPTFSAVPQPTALPRTHSTDVFRCYLYVQIIIVVVSKILIRRVQRLRFEIVSGVALKMVGY